MSDITRYENSVLDIFSGNTERVGSHPEFAVGAETRILSFPHLSHLEESDVSKYILEHRENTLHLSMHAIA